MGLGMSMEMVRKGIQRKEEGSILPDLGFEHGPPELQQEGNGATRRSIVINRLL